MTPTSAHWPTQTDDTDEHKRKHHEHHHHHHHHDNDNDNDRHANCLDGRRLTDYWPESGASTLWLTGACSLGLGLGLEPRYPTSSSSSTRRQRWCSRGTKWPTYSPSMTGRLEDAPDHSDEARQRSSRVRQTGTRRMGCPDERRGDEHGARLLRRRGGRTWTSRTR